MALPSGARAELLLELPEDSVEPALLHSSGPEVIEQF